MSDERHDPFDDVPRDDPSQATYDETYGEPAEQEGFFAGEPVEEEPVLEEHVDEDVEPRRSRGGLLSCLVVLVVVGAIVAGGAYAVIAGREKLQDVFAGPEDYSGKGSGEVVFEVSEGDSSTTSSRNRVP